MSLNCMENIPLSFYLDLKREKKVFYSLFILYTFFSAEVLNSEAAFYCYFLSLLMQAIIELTRFYGNKTDKVFQETRVIDYACTLCHIQLTQSDCTPHYATTCRKINKYGR